VKPAVKSDTGGNDHNEAVDTDRITSGKLVLTAIVITGHCWSSPRGHSNSVESNKSSLPLEIVSRNFTGSMKWLHCVLLH
jgi:hypothetical protein